MKELRMNYGVYTSPGSVENSEQKINDLTKIEGKELVSIDAYFSTKEEAEQFKARFPKYCKLYISPLCSDNDFKFVIHLGITSENNSGGSVAGQKNEAGLKRTKKIMDILSPEYPS